jgi:hypothetical protein
MYDILNISDKYKVLYFNDEVKDSFMNMFLIGLDNSYLDIDMETLNNSSKYYRERLNKKFMNKFNKNFNLNNNRHLSYLSEVCGVDISIQNEDKMRETPRNNKKMLYFIKNDTGYGLVLKNNKKSYKTELLNTELPALEKLSIGGGDNTLLSGGVPNKDTTLRREDFNIGPEHSIRRNKGSRGGPNKPTARSTRSTRRTSSIEDSNNSLLEIASGNLDGIDYSKDYEKIIKEYNTWIINFINEFKELVKEKSDYNIEKFDKELKSLKQNDLIKANLIIELKNNGKFTPETIIEEAQQAREAVQAREAREALQAREAREALQAREALRTQGALQTSTQNLVNKEPTYKEGDVNFIDNKNSTINSINLLLRNDKDVNNLVVRIIQHTKLIKKMINHFISKLLEYKNKKEIIMSENIKQKLEEFKNFENFNIDYLYNLISRDLTLLYISNGFDTLKDFKSIRNITTEIYSYHPNLIWIEGLIALTVLYFSTFIIKYKYNDTNNNEYFIYLYKNNITNENIETYMNNKYIYRFFQELVSPNGPTFEYLNNFFTENKEEDSNSTPNRPYIGYLYEKKFFDNIKYNNILENNKKNAKIVESNKYNNIFNQMQQFFFNNIATLRGATIELDRVSDEMIFSLLKKDDKYTNEQQYKDTTLLVNHDSNNKLEFNNLQLLDRDKESRVPYTLYHSKNYIFNNEHNYLSMSLLDKFFDSGNSSYDEISKIKNTKDIIIPKALSEKYNKYINDKTIELLQDVVGIENIDSNQKYIYTYLSDINEAEDEKFKVIIQNVKFNNNYINNINDIINADYKSILNEDENIKLNICFKINEKIYVRLLSFKLVNGKVTIDNYNTIQILTKNINKMNDEYTTQIKDIEIEKKPSTERKNIQMKDIKKYTEDQNKLDNEMTMRRNILVRLKYLGDYSQYYYAKILQDFIENEDNNENFYRWQDPTESRKKIEANTDKKNYLELKTKYLLIILSRYALIEFNYGINWYNGEKLLIKIQADNSYNYLKLNNKGNIGSPNTNSRRDKAKEHEQVIIEYFKDNLNIFNKETVEWAVNSSLDSLKKYYKRIILYINYINFVYSGFIFEHSLYYETRYSDSEFLKEVNIDRINKIYDNCKNFVAKQENFKFKVFKLYNKFTKFNHVKFIESNNSKSEGEHFTSRMKESVDNQLLIKYKDKFITQISNIVEINKSIVNDNITYNITFENLFKLKLKNPLLSGIVDMLINLNYLDLNYLVNNQMQEDDIQNLCEYLNSELNSNTNNEYGKINDLFKESYSDEFTNIYGKYGFSEATIDNFTKITPINIYYLVYKFKLLKNLEDNENSANPYDLIFIIKKNIDKYKPHKENMKYITIKPQYIKTVRFLMKEFINYQIIDLFRRGGKTPIEFKSSKENYLLIENNQQNSNKVKDNFENNYAKYYKELIDTFKKEGNYIKNKLVNYDESCKLDKPEDCIESIRLTEDMKYNLIRDVNNEDQGPKKTFRVVIDSIDNNLNTQAYLGGVAFTHKYSNNKFKIIEPPPDSKKAENAQQNAENAQQNAENAQQNAENAQQNAENAQQNAENARKDAQQAQLAQLSQKRERKNTSNSSQSSQKRSRVISKPNTQSVESRAQLPQKRGRNTNNNKNTNEPAQKKSSRETEGTLLSYFNPLSYFRTN